MFSSTPKRPTFAPLQNTNELKSTLLPPLSALFTEKSSMFKEKLPTIHDILASQTPRNIHTSSSTLSLSSYSVTDSFLERPAALRPSLSFPMGSLPLLSHNNSSSEKIAETRPNTSVSSDSESPFSETAARIASKIKTNHSPTKDFAFISHSPATFPSQEPSIDNESLARRKRRRTSPNELAILNQEFIMGSTPGKSKRLEISKKVNMTEKAVQIWFQNKRQSIRRLRSCEKEVTELPPTPDTTINSSFDTTGDMSQELNQKSSVLLPTSPFDKEIKDLLSPYRPNSSIKAVHKIEAYDKKPSFRLPLPSSTDKDVKPFMTSSKEYAPMERKPLGSIDQNTMISQRARSSNDVQCIEGLLSLKTAAH